MACGITQDNYNSYGHEYWVITTLTSPLGRSASITSYTDMSYARSDVSLPLDRDDLGLYLIDSEHWYFCPIANHNINDGATGSSQLIAIKDSAYRFSMILNGRCLWEKTCTGKCSVDGYTTNMFNGQCYTPPNIYRQCADLVVNGSCFIKRIDCYGLSQAGICSD